MPYTAIAARDIHSQMEESRSKRQVIILDCCFGGAFAKGMTAKNTGTVNLLNQLGGEGRAILTASTSTQYAFEQDGFELSLYSHFLVEGLETGAADLDGDGWISVDELHDYVRDKVKETSDTMTPEFYPVREGHKIVLVQSPKDDPKLKYRKELERLAKQEQGNLSLTAQRLLAAKRRDWNLLLEEANIIETEVMKPYREYERKLKEFEDTLVEQASNEYPLSKATQQTLSEYQRYLGLRSTDIETIHGRVLNPKEATFKRQQFQARLTSLIPAKSTSYKPIYTSQKPEKTTKPLFYRLKTISSITVIFVLAILMGRSIIYVTKLPSFLKYESLSNSPNDLSPPLKQEIGAEELYNQGIEKYKNGDLQGALSDYTKAVELGHVNADIYMRRGIIFYELELYKEAIEDFEKVIQLEPDHSLAYYGRGLVREKLNDFQGAFQDYSWAILINENWGDSSDTYFGLASAYYNRENVHYELGEYPQALADYNETIQLNSTYADAYNARGNAQIELNHYRQAIAEYSIAIQLKSNFAEAFRNRGIAHYLLEDYEEALTDFNSTPYVTTKRIE